MIRSKFQGVLSTLGRSALVVSVALAGWSCKSEGDGKSGSNSSSGGSVELVGAGATFPAPIYTQWFKDLNAKNKDITVNYQGIGSGGGVKQFTSGTVDFGASDAAMTDEEISKVKGGVVLLPMTAGSVVVAYNAPGLNIKLSRAAYPAIFSGKITKWNDPAIAAANPGVKLPDMPISVVSRADSSGTTYCFTSHLAAIDPSWKAGKTAKFPGTAAKGNDGIAAQVKQTPGSIGYVEFSYSKDLQVAELENKSGKYVKATAETAAAALAATEMPENLIAWITDPAGDAVYPIVTYTWLICKPVYEDAAKGKAVKTMIEYGLTDGQKIANELGYIPLPAAVVTKVKAKAETIKVGA
ncbi:phosphate ABC transporter substrate-binding protein PstS [Humisphaera borealis]|uniref:Phosphate-binding protein n=1 Tax=Humisphaera borealis TaxID=2807512 RepID=A0A7M2WXW0_9BACT|nr:phosphate ABC transporter substrate-binding protein PstS [Humisphaera borealis]QOV90367.1 phosphate ABC transporter substrate-binding protein PstS [Humisphaera borealis]